MLQVTSEQWKRIISEKEKRKGFALGEWIYELWNWSTDKVPHLSMTRTSVVVVVAVAMTILYNATVSRNQIWRKKLSPVSSGNIFRLWMLGRIWRWRRKALPAVGHDAVWATILIFPFWACYSCIVTSISDAHLTLRMVMTVRAHVAHYRTRRYHLSMTAHVMHSLRHSHLVTVTCVAHLRDSKYLYYGDAWNRQK